jgi:hypothetical protein
MRSSTVRAGAIRRNRILPTGVNRLEALAMLGVVFLQQKYVVQRFNLLDDWQFVNSKLIVLGACSIVLGKL